MSPTYAAKTTVSAEASRSEIERTLSRYGAQAFAYGWDQRGAQLEFVASNRRVRFVLPLPARDDKRFTHYMRGSVPYERTPDAAEKEWEQACRQRWRALNLVIKAKLEAVEAGISEFEDEFLAHTVLPDGTTFGQWARPQLDQVFENNAMPALLPGVSP